MPAISRTRESRLGRFLQTDPIRYDDGPNIYAYVHGDPVNDTDPTGDAGFVDFFVNLIKKINGGECNDCDSDAPSQGGGSTGGSGSGSTGGNGDPGVTTVSPVVVNGAKASTTNTAATSTVPFGFGGSNPNNGGASGGGQQQDNTPACPVATYRQHSIGGSATAAVAGGVSFSFQVGISVADATQGSSLFAGTQLFGSLSIAVMGGAGAYAGAGGDVNEGAQQGPLAAGAQPNMAFYGEGDVGGGLGASVSGSYAPGSGKSVSVAPPKLGVGEGVYVGGGVQFGVTGASKPYNCH